MFIHNKRKGSFDISTTMAVHSDPCYVFFESEFIFSSSEFVLILALADLPCKNNINNQRTNGPVNAHLLSGATESTKQVLQTLTLSKNGSRSTQIHHLCKRCRA